LKAYNIKIETTYQYWVC